MVPNVDNKINLIRKNIKLVLDPPPPHIMAKSDTGETAHYFTLIDAHALVNLKPNIIGPQVILTDSSTIYPQQQSSKQKIAYFPLDPVADYIHMLN